MKKLLLMFGLGAMLLTSCDQDITNEIYLPGAGNTSNVADSTKTGYLTINSTIAPNTAMTRAINEQWGNGDAIGVFADNSDGSSWISNGKFIRKDNTSQFTSTNAYYYKGQNECNVKAYYPYNASVTSSNPVVTFTCSEEATAEAQKNTDFMFATDKARWATPPNLVFQHKMSRVIFKVIAGDGFTGNLNGNKASAEFMNGEFMLYAVSGGTFNTKTGAVTASNAYKTYTLSGTNIDAPGDAHCLYYELILPPHDMTNNEFQLVTDTGISITSIIANESNHTKWKPGYTYTYNVICKKEGMNLLLSSIKPWVNGGEGTLTPTE